MQINSQEEFESKKKFLVKYTKIFNALAAVLSVIFIVGLLLTFAVSSPILLIVMIVDILFLIVVVAVFSIKLAPLDRAVRAYEYQEFLKRKAEEEQKNNQDNDDEFL